MSMIIHNVDFFKMKQKSKSLLSLQLKWSVMRTAWGGSKFGHVLPSQLRPRGCCYHFKLIFEFGELNNVEEHSGFFKMKQKSESLFAIEVVSSENCPMLDLGWGGSNFGNVLPTQLRPWGCS